MLVLIKMTIITTLHAVQLFIAKKMVLIKMSLINAHVIIIVIKALIGRME